MNTDQIKGTLKDAAGKVQQKAGELIDSPEQQAKGIAKQIFLGARVADLQTDYLQAFIELARQPLAAGAPPAQAA
ncbi:hypothetical protein PDK10_27095 [Bacillus cereus]|nr:hypothetical protein [Bacillus cereus]